MASRRPDASTTCQARLRASDGVGGRGTPFNIALAASGCGRRRRGDGRSRSRASRLPPSWRSGRSAFVCGVARRVWRGHAGCLRSRSSPSGWKVSASRWPPPTSGLSGAVLAAAWSAIAVPLFVDVALAVLRPVEDLLAQRYVGHASAVLARVRPLVVGITGSYGKTTTKTYVAHLIAGDRSVVASPRSFNNRAGLAAHGQRASRAWDRSARGRDGCLRPW